MGELDVLVAKQAITEVLHRYCHSLDRNDREMASTIWHADGMAFYENIFDGTGEEFMDWVFQAHTGFERTSHQVTNILIEVDGDSATSVTYVTACLRGPGGDIVDRGRYIDAWSRRDGEWRIDVRRFTDDIMQMPQGG